MISTERVRNIVFLVVLFAVLTAPTFATPTINGFWDFNNADGYTLFAEGYHDNHSGSCVGNCDTGILGIATDSTNLYLMFAQQLVVVDNSYGANAVGWSGGHKFSDLTGSDNATFVIKNGGTTLWDADIDYLTKDAANNYRSLGYSGDGHFNGGTAGSGALGSFATSLQWNLAAGNNTCGTPIVDSPDIDNTANTNSPNSNYNTNHTSPNCGTWVFPVIYELSLSLSSLGLAPNANPNTIHSMIDVTGVHNSPSKSLNSSLCDDGVVGPSGSPASVALGCSTSVPEPTTVGLLGMGLLMLGGLKLNSARRSAQRL